MNDQFFLDQTIISADPGQWAAYSSQDHTVVIAGPGSGKTRVLSLKAVKLASVDIQRPSGIVCISYSRETVREIRKRLAIYGFRPGKYDFIGTIHGFCLLHIVQPFASLYPEYKISVPLKFASKETAAALYNGVIKVLKLDPAVVDPTRIDRNRCLSISGKSKVATGLADSITRAASHYDENLLASGHIDFVSLVNLSIRMIKEKEIVRRSLECKFPWLLIDEYQDLGKPLHEMVLELFASTSMKIFAVGDANQSIYGFNGAYPDFLNELKTYNDFKTISFRSNYRSHQDIITASLDALDPSPPKPDYQATQTTLDPAEFRFITCEEDMTPQYAVIADRVLPSLLAKGIPYHEIGIILGTKEEVLRMAQVLKDRCIPFYVAKWGFDESDVISWLRDCAAWVIDRESESFDDLLQYWNNLLKIHDARMSYWEPLRRMTFLYELLQLSKQKSIILEWLQFMLNGLDLLNVLKDSARYPEETDNLGKLIDEAKLHNLKDAPVSRFAQLGQPQQEVTITTRHSCKGLEFEAVILPGMEEDHFPYYTIKEDSREMQEAKRLCYVCVSRAKKVCILLRSRLYNIRTRNGNIWRKPLGPSRFWNALHKRFGTAQNTWSMNSFTD